MKLVFSGLARYADFSAGYALYVARAKTEKIMDEQAYHRVVKEYCAALADRFLKDGIVDLPGLGTLSVATLTRKGQYRGDKFIGYGQYDWKTGNYDGKLKTFGLVFLPRTEKKQNLRCYGFVANRKLFKKMKARYVEGHSWGLLDYKDEMI